MKDQPCDWSVNWSAPRKVHFMSSGKCRLTLMTHRDTPLLIPIASCASKGDGIHSFISFTTMEPHSYSIRFLRAGTTRSEWWIMTRRRGWLSRPTATSPASWPFRMPRYDTRAITRVLRPMQDPRASRYTFSKVSGGRKELKTKTRWELKGYIKGQANDSHQWLAICFVHSRREARRNAASSQKCSEYLFQF